MKRRHQGDRPHGLPPDTTTDIEEILRVTRFGVVVNLLLTVIKVGVGGLIGSLALVADGVHSLFDLVTDLVVWVATRFGARPADEDHPYGHGKIETVGALIISVIFTIAGFEIAKEAVLSLVAGEARFPGIAMLGVALISLVANEGLFQLNMRVAKKTGSQALHANAWHHRSDALSSIAVVAGGVGAQLGIGQADSVAGFLVGLFILIAGVRFIWSSLSELLEHSADEETIAKIYKILSGIGSIRDPHRLRTRFVGRELHIDLHVFVPRHLTVVEGDEIAHTVERRLRDGVGIPSNVIVHVDPEPEPDHHGDTT